MEFTDIMGVTLRPGHFVAWATVGTNGRLATGVVVRCLRVGVQGMGVQVRRTSDGRTIELPYNPSKFAVLGVPVPPSESRGE